MKRALTLGLVLIATAVSAADLQLATRHDELRALDVAPSRASPSRKVQWAPSGNFSALHARAVFGSETETASRPYAREEGKTAAGAGIFLSRDSLEGTLNSAPSLNRFAYGNFNPLRYRDPTGHCGENRADCMILFNEKQFVSGAISKEQYFENMRAMGAGAAVGVGLVGVAVAPGAAAVGALVNLGTDSALQGARQIDGTQQGFDYGEAGSSFVFGGFAGPLLGPLAKAPPAVQAFGVGVFTGVGVAGAKYEADEGHGAAAVVELSTAMLPIAGFAGPRIRPPPTRAELKAKLEAWAQRLVPNEPPLPEMAPTPVSNSSGPRVASEGRTGLSPILMRVPTGRMNWVQTEQEAAVADAEAQARGERLPGPSEASEPPEGWVRARPEWKATPGRGGLPGSRPGQDFTPAGRDEVLQSNASAQPDGIARCKACGTKLSVAQQSKRGVTPRKDSAAVDHYDPSSQGGSGDPSNGRGLCMTDNCLKSDGPPTYAK